MRVPALNDVRPRAPRRLGLEPGAARPRHHEEPLESAQLRDRRAGRQRLVGGVREEH